MLTAIDINNMAFFLASAYLGPVLFYYYWKSRIVDYLIFSGFYVNLGIYALATLGHLVIPDFSFSTAIEVIPSDSQLTNILYYLGSISPFVFYFLIILFFGRGIDTTVARILIKFDLVVLAGALIMWTPVFFGKPFFWSIDFQALMLIRYIVFLLISTPLMFILIDSLIELQDEGNYYFENRKMEIVWKIAIWFTILSSIGFLAKLVDIILEFSNNIPINYIDGLYLFCVFSAFVGVAVVMTISVFNPKGLLVFRYQIIRALSIYDLVEKQESPDTKYDKSLAEIYRYIDKLVDQFNIEV